MTDLDKIVTIPAGAADAPSEAPSRDVRQTPRQSSQAPRSQAHLPTGRGSETTAVIALWFYTSRTLPRSLKDLAGGDRVGFGRLEDGATAARTISPGGSSCRAHIQYTLPDWRVDRANRSFTGQEVSFAASGPEGPYLLRPEGPRSPRSGITTFSH
jgi:hypothetical protein